MSHPSNANPSENSHAIMDKWSVYDGKFILQDKRKDCHFMLWFDCTSEEIMLWFFYISEELKGVFSVHIVTCNMEASSASSKSTGSSPPAQFIKTDIREMKKKIRRINRFLGKLDSEGGRWLDNIGRDMVHLRIEFDRSILRTENALTGMLAELEIKFEKLELKVAKLEATNFSSSSSRYGEKAK